MRTLRCGSLLPYSCLLILLAGCGARVIPGVGPSSGDPRPAKSNPVITWATPAPITNPAPLTAAQLNASANVPGTFVYTPALDTVVAAGSQALSTTFTPVDTADYSTATASVTLTVNPAPQPTKSNPAITWATPAPITNPAPLTATQLDATANVAGTFVYTPALGAVLAAGSQTLSTSFTPTDTADYNTVTASVTLTVNPPPAKTDPAITWPPPAPITNPTPLSATQLDATANVPGTFVYTPPAGTMLQPGTQTLTATFAPTDTADYNIVSASVDLVVNQPQSAGCTLPPVQTGGPSIQPGTGSWLAVADTGDNRILLYAAPFTTNESAAIVLGQPNFTSYLRNQGCGVAANTLAQPMGLAMDAAGNLYVADFGNCRVLQYRPPFATDMSASLVIGVSRMNGSGCIPPAAVWAGTAKQFEPQNLAVDAAGSLWVSDATESLITEYVPPFTTGMSASLSIGQPIVSTSPYCNGAPFTALMPAPSANTLCHPQGILFDSSGDLWVTDFDNRRVLEFAPPFSTGMAAGLELGQLPGPTAFTASGCGDIDWGTTTPVCGSFGIADDALGNLYLDAPSLLEFTPPFSNGMLGQVLMSPGVPGATPAAINIGTAAQMFVDQGGNLVIVDSQFARVLIFRPPFGPGMKASIVIGEPNMTSGTNNCSGPVGANTLCGPWGVVEF